MATKITYNGKTTEVSAGDIATIVCKDFKMVTDVVVEAPESEGKEPILISKTITENGTYKINEKSALGTWRLNSDFKITSVIDVRTEIEGTFVAVAEDGTIQELPLRRFRLNTFDNNTYGTLALKSSRHGFPYSNTTIFDHKQTISLETYDESAGLLYDQQDIPLDSELGEQLRYFTITNVGVMQIGTEEALTEWLYANCTKIAKIDGYSEVIVNVPSEVVEEWDGSGVVIEAIASASLISFTINGTSYQAEEGMIWNEWTLSDYNTDGFSCASENDYVYEAESTNKVTDADGNDVLGTTYIVEGGAYLIKEAVTEDELAGTWVFNDTLSGSSGEWELEFGLTDYGLYGIANRLKFWFDDTFYALNFNIFNNEEANYINTRVYSGSWEDARFKSIYITSKLSEVTNGSTLLTWLRANAIKPSSGGAGN